MRAAGVAVDLLGDLTLRGADHRPPHDAAVHCWAAALRATADEAVVLGDKSKPEDYLDINAGHVVDTAQLRCGTGGGDLMVETKVWYSLVACGTAPAPGCAYHGTTHGFGNQEARAIRTVAGVRERAGDRAWDARAAVGRVAAHVGHYDDGVRNKGNELVITLQDEFSGLAPGGDRFLRRLADRVGDDTSRQDATAYVDGDWAAATFVPHHGQLLSIAVAMGTARRCLKYVDQLRTQTRRAAAERAGAARRTRRAA